MHDGRQQRSQRARVANLSSLCVCVRTRVHVCVCASAMVCVCAYVRTRVCELTHTRPTHQVHCTLRAGAAGLHTPSRGAVGGASTGK